MADAEKIIRGPHRLADAVGAVARIEHDVIAEADTPIDFGPESCGEPQPRPAATRSAGRARLESDAWGWNTRTMVATGGIEPPTSRL